MSQTERDRRARELNRMPKYRLAQMYRTGIASPSGGIARYGGGLHPPEQWTKDEIIASILSIEYPALNPS